MPVRSIELKLVSPSVPNAWQALGTTHRVVMEEAAFYMQELLLLRGRALATADASLARALGHPGGEDSRDGDGLFQVSEATVQRHLAARLKAEFQKADGELPRLTLRLQHLYRLLVPSVEGEEGDAQSANRFMGPLMDPGSEGGEGAYAKAEAPAWVALQGAMAPNWEEAAQSWAIEESTKPNPTGRQPGWRIALQKDPENLQSWVNGFLKSLKNNQAKVTEEGESALLKELRQTGLLPFLKHPPLKHRLQSSGKAERGYLSKWDRLAFKLAVARLLSWESWNLRCAKQREERHLRVEELKARLAQRPDLATHLRAFEAWRRMDLNKAGALTSDVPYALGRRSARNFERLAEAWRGAQDNPVALRNAAATLQKKDPRAFPDPALVGWLLEHPEARALWQDEGGLAYIQLWALHTEAKRRLDRTKPTATLTLIHPTRHPNWVEFESASSNLKNFKLLQAEDGGLSVELPLLAREDAGFREIQSSFKLAPSAQVAVPSGGLQEPDQGKPRLRFVQAPALHRVAARAGWETWEGAVGSAFLQFDRDRLPDDPRALDGGRIGAAFLKLSLDLDPVDVPGCLREEPGAWSREGPKWVHHLGTALEGGQKTPHQSALRAGQRVLCVDLGVRTLGAALAFELTDQPPAPGAVSHPVPAYGATWWGVEVPGSARLLALPGEQGWESAVAWEERRKRQKNLQEPLWLFRQALRRRRILARQLPMDSWDASKILEALPELDGADPIRSRIEMALAALLGTDEPPHGQPAVEIRDRPRWEPVLRECLGLMPLRPLGGAAELGPRRREWDWALEALLGVWRGRSRRRDPRRQDVFGKSIQGIEHLEAIRALLRRWQNRARTGQIKRADRDREGTFASDLLNHINALRDDRLKEGANLLVNAARGLGFDRETGTWKQVHPPCHVLLLEDLNRYRTLKDRPRHENSQLMVWNHRSLAAKVGEMAQLFGIQVVSTGADYSSRFHAASGAPGVRVRQVKPEDPDAAWFKQELESLHLEAGAVKPGDWIPWPGGEAFATLGPEGTLVLEQGPLAADLNAAGSLGRRYLRRHGEAFKVAARQEDGGTWITVSAGVRVQGALRQTYSEVGGRLVPVSGSGGGFRLEPLPEKDWRKATGLQKAKAPKKVSGQGEEDGFGDDELMDEAEAKDALEAEAIHEAHGRPVNFFRDPSGFVLPKDRWYDGKTFWGSVRSRIQRELMLANARSTGGPAWSPDADAF
jgi:hypothetical protein